MKNTKLFKKITALWAAVNAAMFCGVSVQATDGNVANAPGFPIIKTLLQSGLFLIGGGALIFGIVTFAMSFSSEDGEKRTKGIMGMVTGAIILVAAGLVPTFMTGTAPTVGG